MPNPGYKPEIFSGLDTVLEMVYVCDNHGRMQAIDPYQGARDFREDE